MSNRTAIVGLIALGIFAVVNREQPPVVEVQLPVSEPVVVETPGSDDRIHELEAEVARMQADGVVIPEVEQAEAEPAPMVQRGHWEYRRVGLLRRKRVWVNE